MAFVHGKETVIKIDNAAGSLQDLSVYINQSSLQRLADLLDVTTFGAGDFKAYISGFKDAKVPLGGFWDATLDAHMEGILGLATVSIELYPEGEAAGKVKYAAEGILISYEASMGAQQATSWSGEIQITGAVTRSTVSA